MLFNLLYNHFSGLFYSALRLDDVPDIKYKFYCEPKKNMGEINKSPTFFNGRWTCPSGYILRP